MVGDPARGQDLLDAGDHSANWAGLVSERAVHQREFACRQRLGLFVDDATDLGKNVFGAMCDGTGQDGPGRIAEVHQICDKLPNDRGAVPNDVYGGGVAADQQIK